MKKRHLIILLVALSLATGVLMAFSPIVNEIEQRVLNTTEHSIRMKCYKDGYYEWKHLEPGSASSLVYGAYSEYSTEDWCDSVKVLFNNERVLWFKTYDNQDGNILKYKFAKKEKLGRHHIKINFEITEEMYNKAEIIN